MGGEGGGVWAAAQGGRAPAALWAVRFVRMDSPSSFKMEAAAKNIPRQHAESVPR